MLFNSKDLVVSNPENKPITADEGSKSEAIGLLSDQGNTSFIADKDQNLSKAIGQITSGKDTHYYSWGNFNLVRLIIYLIRQTGPVHCLMTSYSFSQTSIEQLQNRIEKKDLLSFRVIIDNRVKTMSPKPFQMLMQSFDYRCTSVHAKVALLWNDKWKLSIVTSQNATDNPKLERGTIFTDASVFNFDLNVLEDEFKHGTA